MRSALVLNATYEPLSVVPSRRAICLVLSDKAEMVEHDGEFVRSERLSMPSPLVIRLRYVVKVPFHRKTSLSRRAVFARDNHRCQYCGGVAESIDLHAWDNVVAACRKCNLGKRDRTPDEAGMRLAIQPITPRELAWVTVEAGTVPEAWKPYLLKAS